MISINELSQDFQYFVKNVAVVKPMRYDSKPGVDTIGIYVEDKYNECREFLIWIRFDNRKSGEKVFLLLLLKDLRDFTIVSSGGECFAPCQWISAGPCRKYTNYFQRAIF